MQGKVDVQVGTTRIRKLSCCQDVIVPQSLELPCSQARSWASSELQRGEVVRGSQGHDVLYAAIREDQSYIQAPQSLDAVA
jgi:hypothetical protein